MEIQEFTFLISNLGFPILACIFMFKQNEKLTLTINKLNNTLTSIERRMEVLEYDRLEERRTRSHEEKRINKTEI